MKTLAWLAVLAMAPTWAPAAEHLVTQEAVQQRLTGVAAQRQQDLGRIDGLLATPAAARAAAQFGADLPALRSAVAQLDARELRELALRAEALQADPAAGLERDLYDLLVIFLVVGLVIIVIQAVD